MIPSRNTGGARACSRCSRPIPGAAASRSRGGSRAAWAHRLFDGESGAAAAAAEAVGVSFDLATRKAVGMDVEVRRALDDLVVPGLSI